MDDKITIVKEWLRYASNDINCAKHSLSMRPVPLEIVCYLCEQAAEKALKGYLVYQNVEPPKTHILKLLCKMCTDIDKSFEEITVQCGNLTLYAVQPRYPFEIEITENDMKQAIFDADRVMEFILQRLQLTEEITQDDNEQKDKQENATGQQLT